MHCKATQFTLRVGRDVASRIDAHAYAASV